MSDIVERCRKGSCKRHNACMYAPCFAVPLFPTDLTAKPVDQFLTENNEILRAEITRLRAELAEARDKALEEAADACEAHMKQFLDDNDVRKMWPATQARNDVYAGIIRALKSPKPQEATMSEGVGG